MCAGALSPRPLLSRLSAGPTALHPPELGDEDELSAFLISRPADITVVVSVVVTSGEEVVSIYDAMRADTRMRFFF